MTPDERWSKAISFKARMGALLSLSSVPLAEGNFRWAMLFAGAFVLAISAATDTQELRSKTLMACAGGIGYSCLIALVVEDRVIQIALFIIAIAVLGLYIHKDWRSRPPA